MKKNIRISFIIIIVTLFSAFFLLPFTILFGPARLRDYVHRELVYKVMVTKLTQGFKSDKEKALKLFYYVQTHLNKPDKVVIDKHPLNDLIRGIGWCGQQANTLITLARKAHIKGRLLFLKGYEKVQQHSVCDLYINGKYRIFDPYYGFIFLTDEGDIATYDDIKNRSAEIKTEQLDAIKLFANYDPARYFGLYEAKYEPTIFRVNFKKDLKRFLFAKLMDFYYDIFDDAFLILFQNAYFKLANTDPFIRSRLKHLSFRFESAIADYDYLIDTAKDDFLKSESMFFKAQLFWDKRNYKKSILEFQKLLKEFPETKWKKTVLFYLGDSYENIKEFDKAEFYYSKNAKNCLTPAPANLIKLIKAH